MLAYTTTATIQEPAETAEKYSSILGMPVYIYKSHDELRWEDYQQRDKGNDGECKNKGMK